MGNQQSSGFPFATLAIVAAFISSTVLAPRAFDLLRPPEGERYLHAVSKQRDIEARLWEDPFAVTYRALKERSAMAPAKAAPGPGAAAPAASAPRAGAAAPLGVALNGLLHERVKLGGKDLIIVALLPGNPYVGAQEARRRTRYALIAGLGAEELWPVNPEHLGLAMASLEPAPEPKTEAPAPSAKPTGQAPRAKPVAGGNAKPAPTDALGERPALPPIPVPYELFTRDPQDASDDKPKGPRQALLLWVDGAALPAPALTNFARMLHQLIGACEKEDCPRLAVIGPSSSDFLHVALQELAEAAKQANSEGAPAAELVNAYRALARATVYNASATAPPSSVLPGAPANADLQQYVRTQLTAIAGAEAAGRFGYHTAVTPDDLVAKALVSELRQRGVGDGDRERVVLIAESDSFYSRELIRHFEAAARAREDTSMRIEVQYYLRGLDGVVTGEGTKDSEARGRDPRDPRSIEWPEARDQRDYIRRMVDRLRQTEQRPESGGRNASGGAAPAPAAAQDSAGPRAEAGPITAIGVLGSDVHDKLIVLQALRDAFPDKPIFTTDLDARYLHPRTWVFSRNLLTASGLALRVAPTLDPSNSVMPMRDSYQTSAYFAARWAAGDREGTRCRVTARLADPRVWEVGRRDFVVLPMGRPKAQDLRQRMPAAFEDCKDDREIDLSGRGGRTKPALLAAGAAVLLGLLALLAYLPISPSLQAIRKAGRGDQFSCLVCAERRRIVTFFLGAYAAVFALAACTVAELVRPGLLNREQIVAIVALGPVVAWLAIFPRADRMLAILRSGDNDARSPADLVGLVVLVALAAVAVAGFVAGAHNGHERVLEPLRWLDGVSAWPSHLLHLAALLVAVVYADRTWYSSLDSERQIQKLLGGDGGAWAGDAPPRAPARPGAVAWIRQWLSARLIATWNPHRGEEVPFAGLWRQYRLRGRGPARLLRVALWSVTTVALAVLAAQLIDIGYRIDVPARGEVHRALVAAGQIAALLGLAILSVAVADATMLSCKFIRFLNFGRSLYPHDVIQQQSDRLGTEDGALWRRVVPGVGEAPDHRGHTLLDDWLDVRVVAARTDTVAKLIIGPFVVLALVIIARSRVFDAWSLNLLLATIGAGFLVWMLVLATLLKMHAERLRAHALGRMRGDLRWLVGSGAAFKPLVEPFKALIASVETNRDGAFAPIFDQPLVRAILVPLGGAGGVQFFDYFLLGR